MELKMWIEIFGYIGSFLVVISMLMSSVVKLRIINLIGSVISGTYAFIIGSIPLAVMNICLIIINVYNLRKLLVSERCFDLVDTSANDAFLQYFLRQYLDDIKVYFSGFSGIEDSFDVAKIICCNADPAGVFLGKERGDGEIEIILDYTIPTYRDCSVGKFLHDELGKRGVKKMYIANETDKHRSYLIKMGYSSTEVGYVKVF